MGKRTNERVIKLFDALVKAPEGLTVYEIGDAIGLNAHSQGGRQMIKEVIRETRLRLGALNGDDDERIRGFTIPIRREPAADQPGGLVYRYVLAASKEAGEQWQGVRTDTLLSRLEVDIAHYQSLVLVTDGRTREGKMVRACLKHFSRLREDLTDIREEV